MAKDNIQAAKLSAELMKTDRREALLGAFTVAVDKASSSIKWYEVSIKDKRRGALTVRLGALLFGALATLTPIVLGMLPSAIMTAHLAQLVALPTVFAAVAAGLVVLDRFFGFSSGWMRYLATYLELQAKIEMFEIAWAKSYLTLSTPVSDAEFIRSLDLLSAFLGAVSGAVESETREWIVGFRGALAEIDQSTRGAPRGEISPLKLAPAAIRSEVSQEVDIVHASITSSETQRP
jgi:SMODS and SLOG-associating 2TM effector domain 2